MHNENNSQRGRKEETMARRGVLISVLILRIFTLLALAASVLVMGLNNFKFDDGTKLMFTKLKVFRYVFACGVAGFVYTLIQTPFALYNVVKDKRWIRNGCLQEFDFYGDKVMGLLLASGVGAGFGLTFEAQASGNDVKEFLYRAKVSTGMLLLGCVSMALLSILSSNRHTTTPIAKRTFF